MLRRYLLVSLVMCLVLSFFSFNSLASGSWDLPIETGITEPYYSESEIKPYNWDACPRCEIGVLYKRVLTLLDYDYVIQGHSRSCSINKGHYFVWYFDVEETYCNRCSYSKLRHISSDYGWHCLYGIPD